MHTVYGLFNVEANKFEYIGCSKDPNRRLYAHTQTKPIPGRTGFGSFYGREDLELIEIHAFESRKQAFQYEGYVKGLLGMEWAEQENRLRNNKKVQSIYGRPVQAYSRGTGELLGEYLSINEAARLLKLNTGNVYAVLVGRISHTGGITFKLKQDTP